MQEFRCEIPRRDGWEQVFEPLVKRITGAQQADVRAGCNYDCEVFYTQPHFLGSLCFCRYGRARREYENDNQHDASCFHAQWKEIDDVFKKHPRYHQSNKLKAERVNMCKQLCDRFMIKYNPKEIAKICTCNFESDWSNLNFEHEADCPKVMPNFWYKKTDLKIWWYRIFFRDAYANQELCLEDFKGIIAICLNVLNKNTSQALV